MDRKCGFNGSKGVNRFFQHETHCHFFLAFMASLAVQVGAHRLTYNAVATSMSK
jgi:hypothetical protein